MHNGIKYTFALLVGAAVGSVVTYKLLTDKYEKFYRDEIESVKEMYFNKIQEKDAEIEDMQSTQDKAKAKLMSFKEDLEEYNRQASVYSTDENNEEEEGGLNPNMFITPAVISPSEYGEDESYSVNVMYYYTDDILADESNCIIGNPDDIVGIEFREHFDDYGDRTVYVRNDVLRSYYEIVQEYTEYSDDDFDEDDEDFDDIDEFDTDLDSMVDE